MPGIAVSGDGRGCNEIDGSFTVDSVSYESDLPATIELTFVQRCDGDTREIRGYLKAVLSPSR